MAALIYDATGSVDTAVALPTGTTATDWVGIFVIRASVAAATTAITVSSMTQRGTLTSFARAGYWTAVAWFDSNGADVTGSSTFTPGFTGGTTAQYGMGAVGMRAVGGYDTSARAGTAGTTDTSLALPEVTTAGPNRLLVAMVGMPSPTGPAGYATLEAVNTGTFMSLIQAAAGSSGTPSVTTAAGGEYYHSVAAYTSAGPQTVRRRRSGMWIPHASRRAG